MNMITKISQRLARRRALRRYFGGVAAGTKLALQLDAPTRASWLELHRADAQGAPHSRGFFDAVDDADRAAELDPPT
jgi:hypothetical protein